MRPAPQITASHNDTASFWTGRPEWEAVRGGYDEGCLIGRGSTKDEAIADLLSQEEDA